MIYHVLPGDAQVKDFRQTDLPCELLVCREALIDGDISGEKLDEFFYNRAAFHGEDLASYDANVASQFRRLLDAGPSDEVNLWFEYELFCAANMWFCIDLLSETNAAVYRVEPVYLNAQNKFDGFGNVTPEQMQECFEARIPLTNEDLSLGSELWEGFRNDDAEKLQSLSTEVSPAFPYLAEICAAAIDRHTRPAEIVREITSDGVRDFGGVFVEFKKRAGIYGYGDSQVQRLLSEPPAAASG